MKSDLVDLTLQLHHETWPGIADHGAVLVSDDGDKRKAVWLPKSAVEIERKPKAIVIVTMPERLAIEKGLV
jgi:hypothetical protein